MALIEKGVATVAIAAAPTWGPKVVEVLGVPFPLASGLLGLLGLVLARLVVGAREGRKSDDIWLTCALCVVMIGLTIERQPGPGMAVFWGVGIGASGYTVLEFAKKAIEALVRGWPGGSRE